MASKHAVHSAAPKVRHLEISVPRKSAWVDVHHPETRERTDVKLPVGESSLTRMQQLESLCGELYQVLGTAGAPESVLDKVYAAAAGQPIPDVDLLPIRELDFDEVRERQETIDEMATLLAKHLAARGGRRSSDAKRAAAIANGRKGGRPRKNA
jgi:hypothetical protein